VSTDVLNPLPFCYRIRVRYGECDGQKVVYNAKYGEYFDLAATEFLRSALAPADVFGGTFEFQVVKLLVEWKASARLDDVLEISVRTTNLGTTSFTLGFELRRAGDTAVIVSGETVNVHAQTDGTSWTKLPLTDAMRRTLMHGAFGKIINHAG
jgi:acyl-CoA thioester hydrolase